MEPIKKALASIRNAYTRAHLYTILLTSTLLAVLAIHSQVYVAYGWTNYKVYLIIAWSAILLSLLIHAIYGLLVWTIAWRKHSVSLIVSSVIVSLASILNYFYYSLNGQHLDYEGVVLTYAGWLSGEIGSRWTLPLAIFVLILGAALLVTALFLVLGKYSEWKGFKRAKLTPAILILVSVLGLVQARLTAPHDFRMVDLCEVLPWANFFGINSKFVPSNLHLLDNPATLDSQTELKALRKANKAFKKLPDTIAADQKPNLLFLLVEGWRWDQLNPVTTPRLWKWMERGFIRLPHHYSTGNTTPSSLFGMFGGMNGFFFQAHLETGITSFPLKMLNKMGYQMNVWEIEGLVYNDIWTMQFKPLGFTMHEMTQSIQPKWLKDIMMIHSMEKAILDDKSGRPRLDFYLFYSSHFDYYYPKQIAPFQPAAGFDDISSGAHPNLRVYREQIFNKYRNSLFFMDIQVDSLLRSLERAGKLDSSIVVISGDHGEEFWEDGTLGHTYRLDDWQTRTAMMVHFPKGFSTQYKVTSHADMMPTIFEYMGVHADWKRFVTGKSLFQYDSLRDYSILLKGGRKGLLAYRAAIAGENYKVIFQNRWNLNNAVEEVRIHDKRSQEFDLAQVRNLMLKVPDQKMLPYPNHGLQ